MKTGKIVVLSLLAVFGLNLITGIAIFAARRIFIANNINYCKVVNKNFDIGMPEDLERIYYNRGSTAWDYGGTDYYVFEITERDEEFFEKFSDIPDEDFECDVGEMKRSDFDEEFFWDKYMTIDPEYLFDLTKPYEWYKKEVRIPDERSSTKVENIGIAFLITNYLKGVFFALFCDRSGAVRSVQHPSRSQKIIEKYALLGASHFCG